jgi:hypothetical protein
MVLELGEGQMGGSLTHIRLEFGKLKALLEKCLLEKAVSQHRENT